MQALLLVFRQAEGSSLRQNISKKNLENLIRETKRMKCQKDISKNKDSTP